MSRPSDPLTGVKCFSIGGRMVEQRQRCLGMTDEERRWRAQWLKDQVLDPEEPRFVPEYYKETTNFFRRLYKTPMYKLELFLEPIIGSNNARICRQFIGKGFLTLAASFIITYFCKYHTDDFSTYRTVQVYFPRPRMLPDHPDYPNIPEKKPSDYYDQGFYSSVLCQDVQYEEPPPEPEPEPLDDGSDIICPSGDFSTYRTVQVYFPRPRMLPDHPDYPNIPEKKPSDYYDQGFYKSVLCKKKV